MGGRNSGPSLLRSGRGWRRACLAAVLLNSALAAPLAFAAAPSAPAPNSSHSQSPIPEGGGQTNSAPLIRIAQTIPSIPPVGSPLTPPLAQSPGLPTTLTAVPPAPQITPFVITPTVVFTEQITDNVNGVSNGKKVDSVSAISLYFDATAQTSKALLAASVVADYEHFLRETSFNNSGTNADAFAQAEIVERFLFIDGHFHTVKVFTNPASAPAAVRSTGVDQTQITTFDASSYIRTTLGDTFDVQARVRRVNINFDNVGPTTTATAFENAVLDQELARITTGDHIPHYQMIATGENVTQDGGFHLYNGIYSILYGRSTGSQLIGRVGYENISDPGITDLQGLIWSGGINWRFRRFTSLHVEYGHRYGKPIWNGDATLAISPKIYLIGGYLRTLDTLQSRISRSITDLTDQSGDIGIGVPSPPLNPIPIELISGTVLRDDATVGLSWLIDAPHPREPLRDTKDVRTRPRIGFPLAGEDSFSVVVGYSNPRSPLETAKQRNVTAIARYTKSLTRQLSAVVGYSYSDNHTLAPVDLRNKIHRGRVEFFYFLTRDVAASVAFTSQVNAPEGGGRVAENVLQFTIGKTF